MREYELTDIINQCFTDLQSNLHTVVIAKISQINSDGTINCLPVINRQLQDKSIKLPEFTNIPVVTLQGGGSYIATPIYANDYCLLLCNERCFDAWFNGQDFVSPQEGRMHDYSDCFALVGVNPQPKLIPIPPQIFLKGNTRIQGDLLIDGNVTINGDLIVNGKISATDDVEVEGISLKHHKHGGVEPGSGQTGEPV